MNSTDIEYVLHCIKNASELINQSESEKAKGLLLSAELLLSEKLTSDNSDYAKCSHVIGLICGVLDITISECDELNLHEIYHKIVEIKNVVKELSQHFA